MSPFLTCETRFHSDIGIANSFLSKHSLSVLWLHMKTYPLGTLVSFLSSASYNTPEGGLLEDILFDIAHLYPSSMFLSKLFGSLCSRNTDSFNFS